MTPIGYLRKVEAFALYIRDHQDVDGGLDQAELDKKCAVIDQSWSELSHEEKLVVYNVVKYVHNNIQPAMPAKEPEKPLIQLLN